MAWRGAAFNASRIAMRNACRNAAFTTHGAGGFIQHQEFLMRKTLLALSAAAAVTLATSASAQDRYYYDPNYVGPVTGAAAGTVAGLALYNGWWGINGGSALGTTFPTTAAGAATVGGVAGIGTAALIHASTTPCQGFHALFGNFLTSSQGCVNGRLVGTQTRRVARVIR
jgi:hypothetical protein